MPSFEPRAGGLDAPTPRIMSRGRIKVEQPLYSISISPLPSTNRPKSARTCAKERISTTDRKEHTRTVNLNA